MTIGAVSLYMIRKQMLGRRAGWQAGVIDQCRAGRRAGPYQQQQCAGRAGLSCQLPESFSCCHGRLCAQTAAGTPLTEASMLASSAASSARTAAAISAALGHDPPPTPANTA